jgi:signal transduction histidine kinase/CheY-like chemotaxis protein
MSRSRVSIDDAHKPLAHGALQVLLVEDSEDDALLVARELSRGGYEVAWERVDTAAAMTAALAWRSWDIVIADYAMPRFSGLAALKLLQQSGVDVPFILVSGTIGEDIAVGAMKAGAHDYIMKGNLVRLVPAVQRELRDAEVRRERRRAEAALQDEAQISAALARVASELISLLDGSQILDRLCQLTAGVLECDASHAFLWQSDAGVYIPVAHCGDTSEQWEALRVMKIPPAFAGDTHERLRLDETVQLRVGDAQLEGLRAIGAQLGIANVLCVALRRGEDIVGVLTGDYRSPQQRFTARQERIARGIAQLASMALENARLVEELERANRLKGEFVATMSHELRTPLNVIIGYTALLTDGMFGALTPDQLDPLRRLDKSARELLDLVTATLDLSRLEAGRLPVEAREFQVRDVIQELAAETGLLGTKPGVALRWTVAGDLPALFTDPVKLKVILKNLVTNAVKFTEQGSIVVDAAPRAGGVEVCVTDSGIGIPGESLPVIFEPFRQADSSNTRPYGGVGLGLYIVRRLLDVLGGSISVESEVGRGSMFRVWLPLRHGAPADQRAAG